MTHEKIKDARTTNLDGMIHSTDPEEDCCARTVCPRCGCASLHRQGATFGLLLICESCDAGEWGILECEG